MKWIPTNIEMQISHIVPVQFCGMGTAWPLLPSGSKCFIDKFQISCSIYTKYSVSTLLIVKYILNIYFISIISDYILLYNNLK